MASSNACCAYVPRIKDAAPVDTRAHAAATEEKTYRITAVVRFEGETPILRTDDGLQVALLGVRVPAPLQARALNYLKTYVAGKRVLLRFEGAADGAESPTPVTCILRTDSLSIAK